MEIECARCGTEDGPFEYFDGDDEYLCTDCVDELDDDDFDPDEDDEGWV